MLLLDIQHCFPTRCQRSWNVQQTTRYQGQWLATWLAVVQHLCRASCPIFQLQSKLKVMYFVPNNNFYCIGSCRLRTERYCWCYCVRDVGMVQPACRGDLMKILSLWGLFKFTYETGIKWWWMFSDIFHGYLDKRMRYLDVIKVCINFTPPHSFSSS